MTTTTVHRSLLPWLLLCLGIAPLTACGGGQKSSEAEEEESATEGGEATEEEAGAEGPLTDETSPCPEDDPSCEADGETVAAGPTSDDWKAQLKNGEKVFDQFCDTCHPGGEEDIGPTLIKINWTVEKMTKQIREGSRKMKPIPVKRLSEAKLADLMAFMTTMKAVKGVPGQP